MSIDSLTQIVSILLAISLASERFVTAIKTLFPEFFEDEKKTPAQEVDLVADKWRRFAVQLIAFLASWFVAGFLTTEKFMLGSVSFADGAVLMPSFIVGLLASGGSSFWNNILGYTKAAKDIQIQQRAQKGLEYHTMAKDAGVVATDGGMVANRPNRDELLKKLDLITPPLLN
ncbi:hypothetical protein [Spirosoma litoris]